mmetsp:Transcript_22593/g.38260  ORF Transcript_22593/g.38260 Transcript_22593/m.38260 type:complete len:257 (+) Transcript_22593:116-886(+)
MMTHKQAWRRQRHSRNSDRTIRFEAAKLHESMNRSRSLPNFSAHAKQSLDHATPRFHTMGNLSNNEDNKGVKFSEKSKVVLIPSRGEYAKHDLLNDIWWNAEDYNYFKASARLEVLDLLDRFKGNIQSALTALYQPEFEPGLTQPDAIATAPNNNNNNKNATPITNSVSQADLCRLANETKSLRVSTVESNEENIQPGSPLKSIIKPVDLFADKPPSGIRAPRDSLRNKNMPPPPPAPPPSSKAAKSVHPLALIMT